MLYNKSNNANLRKVPKKSNDRLKVPKHSKKTREQIERTSILEKAKWELKIMELQEKMFETPVTIEYLKHIAKYFQPAHYEEVVLERKSLNICGYPLCNKKTQQLKGKYRLSSSKKKIFDITELKSYCGSDCMLSSRYFASQLLDDPIYLRNFEKMKDVDVIPLGVNIEEWILREHQKLNTYTERSLDTYVKNMVQTLPNLNKNLIIHEHFGDNQNNDILNNNSIIDKSSFRYDNIEGYQYKPKTNKKYKNNKPSTIILDKELINLYSNSILKFNTNSDNNNNNNNSLNKNKSKEKIKSSVIMNKEEANKFNELYEQYAKKMKEKTQEMKQKVVNNNICQDDISEKLSNLKIDNKIIEKNNINIAENKSEKNIVEKLDNTNIYKDIENVDNNNLKISDDNNNNNNNNDIPKLNENNDNEMKSTLKSNSKSILKKTNSISKDNHKVRFNEDTSVKIIENKEDMNKAYQKTEKEILKRNRNKKQMKNDDVFYSYDVVEKNSIKKNIVESSKPFNNSKETIPENKNHKENKDEINENIISNEESSQEKIKSLFEMNKDLEKILKITEMTKEEAKKKRKKKLVPTLSLFGQIWTTISRMITNETKLFLNNKVTEDGLNEMLLVDDDIMNTRKNILISNIMKSYSSIKLEYNIITAIEDELILLIKSFIVNESMVVLSSVEYWILTVVFLKALTKRNTLLNKEISEEKWKEMIEVVDIPYYQLTEFVNLFK